MTTHPHHRLQITTIDTQNSMRIEIHGDLDYTSADRLVSDITARLSKQTTLTDLYLHCAGLGTVDSLGLSALLMIRRRTTAAGVRLHLEGRPVKLDRLLDLTGTRPYLIAPGTTGTADTPAAQDSSVPVRPTRPDTST